MTDLSYSFLIALWRENKEECMGDRVTTSYMNKVKRIILFLMFCGECSKDLWFWVCANFFPSFLLFFSLVVWQTFIHCYGDFLDLHLLTKGALNLNPPFEEKMAEI